MASDPNADGVEAECVPVDEVPVVSVRERERALADRLARAYDWRSLDELEQEDPEKAREHRRAARRILPLIEGAPEDEIEAAFKRGYDRGRDRGRQRVASELEAAQAKVAELRIERDPEGLRERVRNLECAYDGMWRAYGGRSTFGHDNLVVRQAELSATVQRRAEAVQAAAERALALLAAGDTAGAVEALQAATA